MFMKRMGRLEINSGSAKLGNGPQKAVAIDFRNIEMAIVAKMSERIGCPVSGRSGKRSIPNPKIPINTGANIILNQTGMCN